METVALVTVSRSQKREETKTFRFFSFFSFFFFIERFARNVLTVYNKLPSIERAAAELTGKRNWRNKKKEVFIHPR